MKHRQSGLHNLIRTLRRRLGLTQRELGLLLGYVGDSQVCRLERGTRLPGLVEAMKLELVFKQPAGAIFERLCQLSVKDVRKQIERLNEELLRRGCLQPRVAYKAGQLADVLASLGSHRDKRTRSQPWSVTADSEDIES